MSEKKLKPLQHIPFYLLWIISSIICVINWLTLRSAISAVAAVIVDSVPIERQIERQWYLRWTVPAVDKFALAILGIVAMIVVMALDYVYRDGIRKGTIKKRFGVVTAVQTGLLILSTIVILISSSIVRAR